MCLNAQSRRNEFDFNGACNYIVIMKARIIRIGNSRGVRIPKLLLDQSKLGEEVEIKAQESQILICPARHPRYGWEEAFRLMAERGDDQLLDKTQLRAGRWDREEWKW